jgi:hypothetical protein
VTDRHAEQVVVIAMRLMAAAFALVGLLFLLVPDAVLETMDRVGALLGRFEPPTLTGQPMWLGLAFAYMVVITGLALVAQADVGRYRPLLLVLAAGKAASSLTAGAFFLLDERSFVLLANFAVDAGLMAAALWCWRLAGRVQRSRRAEAGYRSGSEAGASEPSHPGPDTAPAGSG